MRTIHKGKEPRAWVEFRAKDGASYDDVDAPKGILREALAQEQHGLCCYCLGRIEPDAKKMKIEHWASQSDHGDRQLDYHNLLGACLGGDGGPRRMRHCDTAKANEDIFINPADRKHDCSSLFSYSLSGAIKAAHEDLRVSQDIETLVLNHPRLRAGRKERLMETMREVQREKGTMSPERLERMAARLDEPGADGKLKPFCQAAIFWLQRQARKRRGPDRS